MISCVHLSNWFPLLIWSCVNVISPGVRIQEDGGGGAFPLPREYPSRRGTQSSSTLLICAAQVQRPVNPPWAPPAPLGTGTQGSSLPLEQARVGTVSHLISRKSLLHC